MPYPEVKRERVYKTCDPESGRTRQEFANDADINTLIKRWLRGEGPVNFDRRAQYGDFSNVDDYLTAMNALKTAQQAFDDLPARLRNRFDNDPSKLIEFIDEPENHSEAVELGLLVEVESETPPEVPVEPDPEPPLVPQGGE